MPARIQSPLNRPMPMPSKAEFSTFKPCSAEVDRLLAETARLWADPKAHAAPGSPSAAWAKIAAALDAGSLSR
jgi:hypothetical protein